MADEDKVQDVKEESTSLGDVGTDSTSSANASGNVHPHRRRNITIGVIIAVVIVAVIVCILVFAHPWDTDNEGDTNDMGALGSALESSQQINDAGGLSDSSDGNTGDNEVVDSSASVDSTENPTDESDESNDSIDTSDTTAEEEWPGQSLGYVGPNGEGALNSNDFETDEEYIKAYNAVSRANRIDFRDYEIVKSTEEGVADYYKGLICVSFYRSCGELRAREIVDELGGEWAGSDFPLPGDKIDWADTYVYYPGDVDENSIVNLFRGYEEVKWVSTVSASSGRSDTDAEFYSDPTTGVFDAMQSDQYYLKTSSFTTAWNMKKCSHSVSIAILDSGIDFDHEDLADNIDYLNSYDCVSESSMQDLNVSEPVVQGGDEGVSHGSMVAGVAAASSGNGCGISGCSYNADLAVLRVAENYTLYSDGTYDEGYRWGYVIEALQRLVDMPDAERPAVVNMSFVFSDLKDCEIERTQFLINELHTLGVVLVASVGNDGATATYYPAALNNVIGVGATSTDGRTRWPGSNYGACVDICAPGENILTTCNPDAVFKGASVASGLSYTTNSGTSFAAPQVSAAAALVKAQHSSWTASQIENRLLTTATKLTSLTWDYCSGALALDAAAALGYSSSGGGSGSSAGDVFWSAPASSVSVDGYLTAYAVRDGSAGPDFLGISNTNFDFTDGFLYY